MISDEVSTRAPMKHSDSTFQNCCYLLLRTRKQTLRQSMLRGPSLTSVLLYRQCTIHSQALSELCNSNMDPERPSSIFIAPLQVVKSGNDGPSGKRSDNKRDETVKISSKPTTVSQLTPPSSPQTLQDTTLNQTEAPQAIFHNYLRAFYPFQPAGNVSPSTVTLPLSQGDVVLIHSVHTNGWADGTLLENGSRGWLPTNYCEAYEQLPMRHLLKALTDFWDIIRCCDTRSLSVFRNQDYMRGLIAGVRYLLVSRCKVSSCG